MAVRFQFRRGTAQEWIDTNPTLELGEPGFETDTYKLKLGDGITAWNGLAYAVSNDYLDLNNLPTTLAGYGVTDALTLAALSASTATASGDGTLVYDNVAGSFTYTPPDLSFSNIKSKPTTLTGYGITDAATSAQGALADSAVQNNDSPSFSGLTVTATITGKVSDISNHDTDDLSEGTTNIYYTDARARASVSATDSGGDGSFTYDDSTGVFTYTGPSASEVRAHFSSGTGVSITAGEVAIGQSVGTSDNVTFNDMTVSGNLTVNGTTITNSATNTTIEDTLIELGSGNTGANSNDLGLILERGTTGDNGFIGWDESEDKFIVGTTTAVGSDTGDLTITAGTLVAATFEGNLTGNVTGGVTGDISGNVTSTGTSSFSGTVDFNGATVNNAAFNLSGNLTGNVTGNVTGDVTGEVSSIANHTTDALDEGVTNLYFTNARARVAVGGDGTTIAYDDATGEFSLPQAVGTTDDVTFNSVSLAESTDGSSGQISWGSVRLKIKDDSTAGKAGSIILNSDEGAYPTTSSGNSVIIGANAAPGASGTSNTILGSQAGELLTTGFNNVFIGQSAGREHTVGSRNICIGGNAGANLGAGGDGDPIDLISGMIAIGSSALELATGDSNIAIGGNAGLAVTTGQNNIIIGDNAATLLTTGSDNVVIGGFTGNSDGIDIRTSDGHVVIANAGGDIRFHANDTGKVTLPGGLVNRTQEITSSSVTIASDTCDVAVVTPAANITFNAPTGTPNNGQRLLIRIDNTSGLDLTITWNGIFRAVGIALPSVILNGATMYIGTIYNSTADRWDLISVAST
jgi:hypothetical protein